ncbi:unnamed protein product [Eruca vesicaria subsp. sativa]|uniref:Uncharacterized protein n=1 Tax=Eruca vesicaria subsp. sativa TaxID=29727 RepID=A0ABC8JJH5_ERUVS|nr:unnamed protein product [Eruca vesicaria subsp. sativa]
MFSLTSLSVLRWEYGKIAYLGTTHNRRDRCSKGGPSSCILHTGIVPGVYDNNLKITDVLLDSNLAAKISSYNLPLLVEGLGKVGQVVSRTGPKDTIRLATVVSGAASGKLVQYELGGPRVCVQTAYGVEVEVQYDYENSRVIHMPVRNCMNLLITL